MSERITLPPKADSELPEVDEVAASVFEKAMVTTGEHRRQVAAESKLRESVLYLGKWLKYMTIALSVLTTVAVVSVVGFARAIRVEQREQKEETRRIIEEQQAQIREIQRELGIRAR